MKKLLSNFANSIICRISSSNECILCSERSISNELITVILGDNIIGALDAFVKASSIELPKNLRINSVSPTILSESMEKFGDYFRGFESVRAVRVALTYSKSVEGAQTGQVYRIFR